MKRSRENIVDLAVKYFDATITEPELCALKTAFEQDPENRRLFDEYMDIWQASSKTVKSNDYDEKEAWHNLKNRLRITESPFRSRNVMPGLSWLWQAAAAAVIFVFLGTGGYLIYHNIVREQPKSVNTEYYVPFGSRSKVILPDGSSVWLNAGSKMTFDQHFSRKNRDVLLEGEGYFDVRKTKIPFYVKVTGATVKVLGTAFNVKAYPDEKVIETTVTRGTVQVFDNQENADDATRIVLHANQKVSIIKNIIGQTNDSHVIAQQNQSGQPAETINQSLVKSYQVDRNIIPEIFTSWKDQRWIIEREELQSLVIKLGRRYNVEFTFKDEALKHYVFSGVLKDETLEQVMEAIKLTAPIQYQIDQKQVTLSKNKFYKTNQP
ncbi:MAG: FecR family protein [Bacteroidales bacterium]|nr:FecR family protein [Bacteroidales bacterium]MBN2761654.1 FecR family protein [Bacteroidales bacterium]